jgi:hypothetical protein
MNKREICERLLDLRDYAVDTDTYSTERNLTLHNVVKVIAKDLRDLLLDIAVPEEKPEEPKPETPSLGENTQDAAK